MSVCVHVCLCVGACVFVCVFVCACMCGCIVCVHVLCKCVWAVRVCVLNVKDVLAFLEFVGTGNLKRLYGDKSMNAGGMQTHLTGCLSKTA